VLDGSNLMFSLLSVPNAVFLCEFYFLMLVFCCHSPLSCFMIKVMEHLNVVPQL
jgi:hypothetical protein